MASWLGLRCRTRSNLLIAASTRWRRSTADLRGAPLLQPGTTNAGQYYSRPDGRDIDDDNDTRNYFKVVLEEANFKVIGAENGIKGIEVFNEKNPDLVLLDLRMPGISGFEVLLNITASSPQTPVIVVSATDSIDDVVESLRLGAWDFILKPMSTYKSYLEVAIFIDYDFQPEEAMVMYPNDSAYPGAAAEVTINSVQIQGQDISLTSTEEEIMKAEIMEYENTPPEER